MEERAIHSAARDGMADGLWEALGIGIQTGMRSMSGLAALTWAASPGRTRAGWIPSGPEARGLATTAALAEMAGDKMPFAPDRRIVPSFLLDWARALAEDALAASLTMALVRSAARAGRT